MLQVQTYSEVFGKCVVVSLYEHHRTPVALEQLRDWLSQSSARQIDVGVCHCHTFFSWL